MYATQCVNEECAEAGVVKDVPDSLADAEITCGICGHVTSTPVEANGNVR